MFSRFSVKLNKGSVGFCGWCVPGFIGDVGFFVP